MALNFHCSAATHPGRRRRNEDSFCENPAAGVWAVADGVGGASAGDLASATLSRALLAVPPGLPASALLDELRQRLAAAHAELRAIAGARGGATIASTVVLLAVAGGHFVCLWAGDSRAYLLRNGELAQITRDHSLVQSMVESGALAAENAERHPQANVITRAVGAGEGGLQLDKVIGELQSGDRFLLCSDGLTKVVPRAHLEQMLGADDATPHAERLVDAALRADADDNVTALVVTAS